jgi:hypothetical protein
MKLFVLFFAVALATVSAASYSVNLAQPTTVAGKELKAGEYRLEFSDGKAILGQGKQKVEATVKVETSDSKFSSTSVRYSEEGGKAALREIRLGGTNTKLIFN